MDMITFPVCVSNAEYCTSVRKDIEVLPSHML